jgi:hypothetical protein
MTPDQQYTAAVLRIREQHATAMELVLRALPSAMETDRLMAELRLGAVGCERRVGVSLSAPQLSDHSAALEKCFGGKVDEFFDLFVKIVCNQHIERKLLIMLITLRAYKTHDQNFESVRQSSDFIGNVGRWHFQEWNCGECFPEVAHRPSVIGHKGASLATIASRLQSKSQYRDSNKNGADDLDAPGFFVALPPVVDSPRSLKLAVSHEEGGNYRENRSNCLHPTRPIGLGQAFVESNHYKIGDDDRQEKIALYVVGAKKHPKYCHVGILA